MNFNDVNFLGSFVDEKDFPKNKNEILLLGRSNVGKSTFINKLCDRKKIAHTSNKPGKTQTLNFYEIGDVSIIDAPGYGYARTSKKKRTFFGRIIENYLFDELNNLKFVCLLIDFKVGFTKDDLMMYEFLKYHQFNFVIIATKEDKVKNSLKYKQRKIIENIIGNDEIYYYSFENKQSIEKIREIFKTKLELI